MPAPRIAALLGLLALAACEAAPARHSTGTGITLVDDVGRSVHLAAPARRIVSLKPSITETLVLMGAGDRIVGRSTADDHPAVQDLPSIGDALDPNMEALASLRPDLVLIWESTTPSVRERIEALGIPTFAVQSHDTAQIFRSFHSVGQLTGMSAAADSLAGTVRGELAEVAASVRDLPRPTTFVVVWNDPPMTAGPDSYLGQLVSVAGGEPMFAELRARFAAVSMEELVRRQPEILILPQGEDDQLAPERIRSAPGWRELRALRDGRTGRIPSDLISRAGPTIGASARRLRDAIHPEAVGR